MSSLFLPLSTKSYYTHSQGELLEVNLADRKALVCQFEVPVAAGPMRRLAFPLLAHGVHCMIC